MGTDTENKILDKLDEMREHQFENGLSAKGVEGRVGVSEKWIEKHEIKHTDNEKHWRKINQKMWMSIIGGIIGLIFLMLKDQII